MKAAVIGTGLIGRAWAIVFARGGNQVSLFDADAGQVRAALDWIARSAQELEAAGLIDHASEVTARIAPADSLRAAVSDASHVQENIAERPAVKQQVFAELEALAGPETVFASSSSAIMPSEIFGHLRTRSRCLVAHPMNPPHLAPFVELCGAAFTDATAITATRNLMSSCGMEPVTVHREIEGFVLNRLQHALLAEAFRLIQNGYVSPSDLDKALKDGLALRWSFMGPIETIDLNAPGGVADYLDRYGGTVRRAGDPAASGPEWTPAVAATLADSRRSEVPADKLADAQAWRDRRLMALLKHKKEQVK